VLYEPRPVDQAVLIYIAFTLKSVLFIFLSNIFESRRLLYYTVELFNGEEPAV
jgi:hypothetical protein